MPEETKETKKETTPAQSSAPANTPAPTNSGSNGSNTTLKVILIIIGVLIVLGLGGCLVAGWVATKAINKGVESIEEEANQIQSDLGSAAAEALESATSELGE